LRRHLICLSGRYTSLSAFFFLGRGFTIGQAAQRAPQKTTDPALAGSVRTRCPRTHNWCDRHTPHPSALAAGVPVGATYIAAVPGAPAVCVEAKRVYFGLLFCRPLVQEGGAKWTHRRRSGRWLSVVCWFLSSKCSICGHQLVAGGWWHASCSVYLLPAPPLRSQLQPSSPPLPGGELWTSCLAGVLYLVCPAVQCRRCLLCPTQPPPPPPKYQAHAIWTRSICAARLSPSPSSSYLPLLLLLLFFGVCLMRTTDPPRTDQRVRMTLTSAVCTNALWKPSGSSTEPTPAILSSPSSTDPSANKL
jgi:hypothetical protein